MFEYLLSSVRVMRTVWRRESASVGVKKLIESECTVKQWNSPVIYLICTYFSIYCTSSIKYTYLN
jgi:hypothetical protein